MSGATYFVQECPTCSRQLQVRLEYLGRTVACEHCKGRFEAADPALSQRNISDSAELLLRADELLASVETVRARPR